MFVRNWMSAPPLTLLPGATVSTAVDFLRKRKIRRAPVLEEGRLVGIVTLGDLTGTGKRHGDKSVTTVENVMTRKPVTVEPLETLESAAQKMLTKKISGLPVLDGERLVGILTESDLFRALCGMMGIGEKGARLSVTVPDTSDLLESIRGRLAGLAVRSLVTIHDPKRNVWDVVLRVRGRAQELSVVKES
jgi:acetoin utilization protein AcuB